MGPARPFLVCDRARAQISAGLDGELSQLERAMIASHLDRCGGCREYEAGVTAVAAALRSTPMESLGREIAVSAPRSGSLRARVQVVAAAAVAAAAGLIAASQLSQPDSLDLDPAFVPTRTQVKYESRKQVEIEQALLERAEPGKPVELRGRVM